MAALSRELRFADGRVSNPANQTKNNLQADHADPKYADSVQIVSAALSRSREFVDFAMPKRIAPPLLCRYEAGMKYGAHADASGHSDAAYLVRRLFMSGGYSNPDHRLFHYRSECGEH